MGISEQLFNKCRSAILIPSEDISHFMVHREQIEEQNLKQVCRELKRTRAEDGNSAKITFEVQDNPRFKKRFPNQKPYSIPRVNQSIVSTLKLKEEKGSDPYVKKSICAKCCWKHEGQCLIYMGNWYGCGKSGQMEKDFPMMKVLGRWNAQEQASAPNLDAPKKKHFYPLPYRGDQEESPDVATAIIQEFYMNV